MQEKLKISMLNTNLIWKTALKFDINFNALTDIVLTYITNQNAELYFIKMANLCGQYDPFIRQILAETIRDCQGFYQQFDHIERIMLTESRLIITHKEIVI